MGSREVGDSAMCFCTPHTFHLVPAVTLSDSLSGMSSSLSVPSGAQYLKRGHRFVPCPVFSPLLHQSHWDWSRVRTLSDTVYDTEGCAAASSAGGSSAGGGGGLIHLVSLNLVFHSCRVEQRGSQTGSDLKPPPSPHEAAPHGRCLAVVSGNLT